MEQSEEPVGPQQPATEWERVVARRDAVADQRDIDLESRLTGAAAHEDQLSRRTATARDWEQRLNQRSETLDSREEQAVVSATTEAHRAAVADERDRLADLRERAADRREEVADQREIDEQLRAWKRPST